MKRLRAIRELSTVAILIAEVLFFAWYLWPEAGRAHPFVNAENALLILKYSSIYGIAAVGAAVVIISGGIDLAPGAVIALASVIVGHFFVAEQWPLAPSLIAGLSIGVASGLLTSLLVVMVKLPPFIADAGRDGHHARRRVHHHRGAVLRRLEPAAFGLAADGRADRLARAERDVRDGDRLSDTDDAVPVGPLGLLDRRQRNGGAVLGDRYRPGEGSVYVISGLLASLAGSSWCSCRARVKPTLRPGTSWISSLRQSSAAPASPEAAAR
jgi:hypothetical protein